jgi:hypothetical protein
MRDEMLYLLVAGGDLTGYFAAVIAGEAVQILVAERVIAEAMPVLNHRG